MTVHLRTRRYYARATRHNGECYGAVLDASPGSKALCFMRVEGTRENLIYRASPEAEEVVLAENTYVLSPHFAGGYLFWVERVGGDWQLRAVKADRPAPDKVAEPIATAGRPLFLSSCTTDDGALLTWEERLGKRTRVRLVRIRDNEIAEPVDVTDGQFNAYDPACCLAGDGNIYVAYCAFAGGQYRILVQAISPSRERLGKPVRVSNSADACLWPSVCARREGGIWFSYTCFDVGGASSGCFVQHHRFLAQMRFFHAGSTLYAGLLKEGRNYGVLAPPVPGQSFGYVAAMEVYGSRSCGHSHVFEDPDGRLRLLLRQYVDLSSVLFDKEDPPLKRLADKRLRGAQNNHPTISIITLKDAEWTKPLRLIPRAHFEAPVSFGTDGQSIRIAFTEDARQTDWGKTSEWFDGESELAVGLAEVKLEPLGPPQYEFRPCFLRPDPGPSIENPPLDSREGKYMHAVGQTHAHTNLSVCCRASDRDHHLNYRFTQDVQHSDFCATTDHAYNMWHTEMLLTRKCAEYYYFPGEFVAIPAYEWTGSIKEICSHEGGPWGHVNPLYLEEEGDLEFFTPVDPKCDGGSLPRLWKAYAGKKIATPPHHVADNIHPYNWNFFDPTFEPVVEIFQDMRGSGEKPWAPGLTNFIHEEQGHWIVDAMKTGKRFGFIGSADHCGIARAGILVKELTRTGLYEALMARRCFATTSICLRLSFTCNGHMMGTEVKTEKAKFRLSVTAPEPISELQIVRNGEDMEAIRMDKKVFKHAWKARRETPGEFWYCRLIFTNGEVAWSSPIWLI